MAPPDQVVLCKLILDSGVLLVTVLLMLTVGMDLEVRRLREMARRRATAGLLLGAQVVLLPLLGIAVARWLALPPHLAAGILLMAACPVGDIANFYTLLARGNAALSLTLNTLSCLLCAATMAATFAIYDALLPHRFALAVPTPQLVTRLVLMLLLPVLAGMAVRHFRPALAQSHGRTLRNLSFIGVALLVVFIFATRRAQLAADWQPAMVGGLAFMLPALALGIGVARGLRLGVEEAFTTGIVFAARNVGLATAIAVTLLGRLEYAVFAAVYFLTEVPLLFLAVALYRRWRAGLAATAPPLAEVQS